MPFSYSNALILYGSKKAFSVFLSIYLFFPLGLQRLLDSEMGVHLLVATIKRTRKKLGWKRCGPKYCQVVRETNRVAHLAIARECQETGETFDNLIFSDASTKGGSATKTEAESQTSFQSTHLGRDF